jgi:UPF0716 protein FxsA
VSARPVRRRGAGRWRWVPVGLLVLLVVEVWLLTRLGHLVGGGWVLVLLLVETLAGALVLRRAGRGALRALRNGAGAPGALGAPGAAGSPGAVGDAVLTGAGGALLVLPGLLSDVVGLLCLFPPTRRLLGRSLARLVRRRVERAVRTAGGPVAGDLFTRGPVVDGEVVDGEVVDGEVVEAPRELGR